MTLEWDYVVLATLAVVITFIISYIWGHNRIGKIKNKFFEEKQTIEHNLQELKKDKEVKSAGLEKVEQELKEIKIKDHEKQKRIEDLLQQLTLAESEKNNVEKLLKTQKQDLESLEKRFREQFENIASKILKENTVEFSDTQRKSMFTLLSPLKEKLTTFEKKIEDTYEKGLKDQTDMRAELKKLYDLNTKISTEANNLTNALKQDSKQQGNWGELVLERILERSGLTKNIEYKREVPATNEDRQSIRPDAVIYLPENKHIIIDSKVSLISYERAVNSKTEAERKIHIKNHLSSLRNHIKGLSAKHYQSAFNTPDFVLLFVPVESSFAVAVQEDKELFNTAWDNKIIIVSPSTLLATLRTVASIWKQEKQTRNVKEIASQGALLYDKFVGFYEDLIKVGKKMDEAKTAYTNSIRKLHDGKDNLVRKVERLRELGARPKKEIPKQT